jgi:alanyl-tRNA synthetase
MRTSDQIRQEFIDFFVKQHGHTFVPSSPVVPQDDPTLLFSNAGMNQFKPVFLGIESRPYTRAANTQKCIRAGGKHNDLDDVGKDTYHHTFFEMLGNWSFGDYFKKEAIRWAWQLLTEVWGLDRSRLHATVFEGTADVPRDEEAAGFWRSETDIDPANIHYGSAKDNFWEMGETGPCGPCTEIHIDKTPGKTGARLVNAGTQEVIEVWNLVFIQFNRNADRSLTPLPARHVDTGMGLERVTAVIQGKDSNYDTDLFTPLLQAAGKILGREYGGRLEDLHDIGLRVITDHLRMATFAICDGARPGTKKRDAVLRSVLRRAVRFGYQCFGQREPFVFRLVPTLVDKMGGAFPELKAHGPRIEKVIREEEAEFLKTIQRGLVHFGQAAEKAKQAGNVIDGREACSLRTTYGFPIDLTQQMAQEQGLSVDMPAYQAAWEEHIRASEGESARPVITAVQGDLPRTDDSAKYQGTMGQGEVLGWVQASKVVREGSLGEDEEAGLLLSHTCFYAESGGQVGDTGRIRTATGEMEVLNTQKMGEAVLHVGRVTEGRITPGQRAELEVGGARPDIMRNHTATHLLNWALREVLGDGVDQKGSLVDAEKTRFDFTHDRPLTSGQVAEVERLVNEKVYSDLPVTPVMMPLAEAKRLPGLRAVFGEKYPDPVRVLIIGAGSPREVSRSASVELCGGTHVQHTGQIGPFKIISQEGVAKGVRRVTAVTGRGAVQAIQKLAAMLEAISAALNCKGDEAAARVEALQEEVRKLTAQLKKGAAADLNSAGDALFSQAVQAGGAMVLVGEVPAAPIEQMRSQMDRLRQKSGNNAVVLVGWVEDGKVGLMAAVTDNLTGKVEAGKLVGEVARAVGGKGGGRKDLAQAGGSEPARLKEALDAARQAILARLA